MLVMVVESDDNNNSKINESKTKSYNTRHRTQLNPSAPTRFAFSSSTDSDRDG